MHTETTMPPAALRRDTRRSLFAKLAIVWCVLILAACWTPRNVLPVHEPAGPTPIGYDKIVHFGIFAVLGFLVTGAARRGRALAIAAATCILVVVVSELGQTLPIVGRDANVLDGVADLLGVAVGIGAALWIIPDPREPQRLPASPG